MATTSPPTTRPASGSAFPRIDGLAPLHPLPEADASHLEDDHTRDKVEALTLPPPGLNPTEHEHEVTLDDEPEINLGKLDRMLLL
jgi:hypothetical protein